MGCYPTAAIYEQSPNTAALTLRDRPLNAVLRGDSHGGRRLARTRQSRARPLSHLPGGCSVAAARDDVLGSVSNLAVTAFSTTSEVLDAVLALAQDIPSMGTVFVSE